MDKNAFAIFVVLTVLAIGIGVIFFAKNNVYAPVPPMIIEYGTPSPAAVPTLSPEITPIATITPSLAPSLTPGL